MRSLKRTMQTNLRWLAAGMIVVLLLLAVYFQVIAARRQTHENAEATFQQVKQIIEENQAELAAIKAEYSETCLLNAEVIAEMVHHNPELIGDVPQFRELARKLEVDEIHIFNKEGSIFSGTHPEYYNFSVYDGGQIGFFKALMDDKSLKLCQDITPNTAEGKLVQYSALWSSDGEFIVQVGMYPDAVLAVTRKNELSYIFSLLQGNPGVALYAIDAKTGVIIGSTVDQKTGKDMHTAGFARNGIDAYRNGAQMVHSGVKSYCIFMEMDDTWLAYVIANDQLYNHVALYIGTLLLGLFVVAMAFVYAVQRMTDRLIISSIARTNTKLRALAEGNLDERIDIQSSREFSELSSHINHLVQTLLASTDKMSYVLNRTNMRIGVYEYNLNMKPVRFTERIPEIFDFSAEMLIQLRSDYREMQRFLGMLRREPVQGEENVYRYVGQRETYVRLEEIVKENDVLGIVIDVTEEILSLRRAEAERDIDMLTGIYNRRGVERRFFDLFADVDALRYGAMIVIDADNLKDANDQYGHAIGDRYLKHLAGMLNAFDAPNKLAGRIGGDEFALLIYGYEDAAAVHEDIAHIHDIQDNVTITLNSGEELTLKFSYGYEMIHGRSDYDVLLASADSNMYASKRLRKKGVQVVR